MNITLKDLTKKELIELMYPDVSELYNDNEYVYKMLTDDGKMETIDVLECCVNYFMKNSCVASKHQNFACQRIWTVGKHWVERKCVEDRKNGIIFKIADEKVFDDTLEYAFDTDEELLEFVLKDIGYGELKTSNPLLSIPLGIIRRQPKVLKEWCTETFMTTSLDNVMKENNAPLAIRWEVGRHLLLQNKPDTIKMFPEDNHFYVAETGTSRTLSFTLTPHKSRHIKSQFGQGHGVIHSTYIPVDVTEYELVFGLIYNPDNPLVHLSEDVLLQTLNGLVEEWCNVIYEKNDCIKNFLVLRHYSDETISRLPLIPRTVYEVGKELYRRKRVNSTVINLTWDDLMDICNDMLVYDGDKSLGSHTYHTALTSTREEFVKKKLSKAHEMEFLWYSVRNQKVKYISDLNIKTPDPTPILRDSIIKTRHRVKGFDEVEPVSEDYVSPVVVDFEEVEDNKDWQYHRNSNVPRYGIVEPPSTIESMKKTVDDIFSNINTDKPEQIVQVSYDLLHKLKRKVESVFDFKKDEG